MRARLADLFGRARAHADGRLRKPALSGLAVRAAQHLAHLTAGACCGRPVCGPPPMPRTLIRVVGPGRLLRQHVQAHVRIVRSMQTRTRATVTPSTPEHARACWSTSAQPSHDPVYVPSGISGAFGCAGVCCFLRSSWWRLTSHGSPNGWKPNLVERWVLGGYATGYNRHSKRVLKFSEPLVPLLSLVWIAHHYPPSGSHTHARTFPGSTF